MGSGQASPVREEGNMLFLWKCEYAARRGLRTAEEKRRDHFNFWSRSSESESDPNRLHRYILWFLWSSQVLDKGSVALKVLAMFKETEFRNTASSLQSKENDRDYTFHWLHKRTSCSLVGKSNVQYF